MIMLNKKSLKEMFNFTTNKKQTIKIASILFVSSLPYLLFYQVILSLVVDKYMPNQDLKMVCILSCILLLIIMIRFTFDYYTETRRKTCYYDNDRQIKNKIFSAIQYADIGELDNIQTGNLFELTTNQSFNASQLFVWNFTGIFSVRFRNILMISIIMLFVNFKIALIIICIFIVSYIILLPFYNANIKNYQQTLKTILNLQGKINEYIESYSTTKTLRLEEINMNEINDILSKSKEKYLKTNKILALHTSLFALLTFSAVIITLIIGGNEIVVGVGVASTIMLLVDYINDINSHMQSLLNHAHGIISKYNAFLRIFKIMNLSKEIDEGTENLDKVESIEFNNVTMSYDGENVILKDINLKIDKPMTVAIVGKSGSGKTTLVNLIPRFYQLLDGKILVNNYDYKNYKLSELRKNISYVFQEPVILNMSIKDNLMYGLENISFEEIKNICIKLGLHNKILSLPNGYDTIINSKTDLLSFGEKQLLSYARAILKDGDIVILDEVTSNLDLNFEQNIIEANKTLLKGKIAFIIAHRLNTIKESDLIIFIEDKHIEEMGTHEELLKLNGKYSELFMTK
jgi:ATP-binding cassette subfamily B protein